MGISITVMYRPTIGLRNSNRGLDRFPLADTAKRFGLRIETVAIKSEHLADVETEDKHPCGSGEGEVMHGYSEEFAANQRRRVVQGSEETPCKKGCQGTD